MNALPASTRALLFDMNGTLIADSIYHSQAFALFFSRYNLSQDWEELLGMVHGWRDDQIMRKVFGNKLTVPEVTRLSEEKEAIYRELYAPHIVAVPGAIVLIRKAKAAGIKLAIATSSPRSNLDFVIRGLGLEEYIEVTLSGGDVGGAKPDPEIYLEAARRLGCGPEECVVFEDSQVGIEAGLRAGCVVVGVATVLGKGELVEAGAWQAVDNFQEVSLP